MRLPIKLLSLALILTATWCARADTLNFTLSGGGDTFTFSLPSNPSPDSSISGTSFTLMNILITQNSTIGFSSDLTFSNSSASGGLEFALPSPPPIPINLDLIGPQLYAGSEASPIFSATTTPFTLEQPKGSDPFTLGIAAAQSPVPEPSSFALLATGLFALSGAARSKSIVR